MEKSSLVRARFQLKKGIYDDGETIDVLNISKYAKKYFWEFGDDQISTEFSPSFTTHLNDLTRKKITISLHVIGENGNIDTFKSSVLVCKRLLVDFCITRIDEELRKTIVEENGKSTFLFPTIGPIREVRGWSPDSHRLPIQKISKNFKVPFKYNRMGCSTIALNDENWYLRLSTLTENSSTPIFLYDLRFNPSKIPYKAIGANLYSFTISDDQIEIDITFQYEKD